MKTFLLTNSLVKNLPDAVVPAGGVLILSAIVAAKDKDTAVRSHPCESEEGVCRDIVAEWPTDPADIGVVELGDYVGPTYEDDNLPITLSQSYLSGIELEAVPGLHHIGPAACAPSLFAKSVDSQLQLSY